MNELLTLANILQGIIILGIVWLLKGVSRINGSIREINAWRAGHEDLNELQWRETKDKFHTLFGEINKD